MLGRLLLLLLGVLSAAPAARGAVVAFTGGNYTGWETWDWETITHLGFWTKPNDAQRDLAKAHGVRLFIDGGLPDKSDWTDASARQKFGAQMAQKVQDKKVDGVFFDYEGNGLSKEQKAGYGLLAEAVTAALAPLNATIFVCVGGRPEYELRDYPYAVLANHSEFLFIMGYDMHFWDDYTCVLKGTCTPAEAGLPDLTAGVKSYTALVDPKKLVLGLPWYGQRYTDIVVPWNMGQIDYYQVLQAIDTPGRVTKKEYDNAAQSWKITCKGQCSPERGGGSVVWYDDATSLAPKYKLAADHGLLGVGMWSVDKLPVPQRGDSSDPHAAERKAMWAAIANWQNKSAVDRL